LVPALAISFALMKGIGMEKGLLAWISLHTAEMPVNFRDFVDSYIIKSITELNFAALGGIGVAFLLVTTVQLMSSIEDSFNTSWAVSESRPLYRKFTDYVSTVIIVPVLILAAGTLRSQWVMEHLGFFSAAYAQLLKLSGLFTAWMAFALVYKLLPNTRVHTSAAMGSGFVAALAWLGWQKMYVLFQIGVAKWNPIYGTFATIPIFLFWLYVSWSIVLIGAEFSFALQNSSTFAAEQRSINASTRVRLRLALDLLSAAAERQIAAGKGLNLPSFAAETGAPLRLLHRMCDQLKQAGLLAEVKDSEETFLLAWPADKILVRDVAKLLFDEGEQSGDLGLRPEDEAVRHWMEGIDRALRQEFGDISIASRATKPPATT
jgi:membrane protein